HPQQTVTCWSAITSTPYRRVNSRATASRSGRWPQVTAYWLSSELIAAQAASFTAIGAEKSGNPCDRLTALCASLSRVISRMTDSVNCSAFFEPVSLDIRSRGYYAAVRFFFFERTGAGFDGGAAGLTDAAFRLIVSVGSTSDASTVFAPDGI